MKNRSLVSVLLTVLLVGAFSLSGCSQKSLTEKPDGWRGVYVSSVRGEEGVVEFFRPGEFKYEASADVKDALVRATGVDASDVVSIPYSYGVRVNSLPGLIFVPPDLAVRIIFKSADSELWRIVDYPTGEILEGKLDQGEIDLFMSLFAKE